MRWNESLYYWSCSRPAAWLCSAVMGTTRVVVNSGRHAAKLAKLAKRAWTASVPFFRDPKEKATSKLWLLLPPPWLAKYITEATTERQSLLHRSKSLSWNDFFFSQVFCWQDQQRGANKHKTSLITPKPKTYQWYRHNSVLTVNEMPRVG